MPKSYNDLSAEELAGVHNISVPAAQAIIEARPAAEAKRAARVPGLRRCIGDGLHCVGCPNCAAAR